MNDELSPELALVSPDLAAQARAALPDRPWEAFAPTRGPIERIGPPPRVAPDVHASSWVERVSSAFPIVMLAVFLALLIVGSLPGLSQGPTLGPPETTLPAPTVPPTTTP